MDELLADYVVDSPGALLPVMDVVERVRGVVRKSLKRDEVLAGLTQMGYRLSLIRNRLHIVGATLK